MASTIPSSTNTISQAPGIAFITKKNTVLSKCSFPRKLNKQPLAAQKCILPFSTSLKLFPQFLVGIKSNPKQRTLIINATGTDVALEEPDLSEADKEGLGTSEETSAKSDVGSTQAKRSRSSVRKSDMPPVKNEELIPGATFTGKVKSVQPFGAFVDFGAFTDGLVHVSQLSDSFVKDVASVVTVGQEVKVRLVEVNMESKRISLTMRENDATSKSPQQRDDKSRPPRKGNQKKEDIKPSKFVKGQDLDGTVKNTTRSGAFISLPEGEEGFLPTSEEADEGFVSMMGGSSLEIGQEVKVRVLRINRGKVTLTMKKAEAGGELDAKLSQGVVYSATNPFLIAFRSNKVISDFLDERENENGIAEKTEEDLSTVATDLGNGDKIGTIEEVESSDIQVIQEPSPIEAKENDETAIPSQVADLSSETVDETTEEAVDVKVEAEANTLESSEEPLSVDATESTEPVVSGELTEQSLSDVTEEVIEKTDNEIIAKDEDQSEKPEETATPNLEESSSIESSTTETQVSVEDSENREGVVAVSDVETPTPADSQEKENASESSGSGDASPIETTTKATISPALVKQLRDETGAGMMDCKKALTETEGDIVKAQEYLRKKGLASADKKSSRVTAEGRIGSYIHDSRIGVLIEVNCETDFVARGDIFKELVEDLSMQVAACPQVQYLSTDDIPKEIVEKEKELEMQKEDLLSKPEQMRERIVDGRIRKRMEEIALLEQPFIKNDKVVVKDWVKQTISTIGENIKVKRFLRYNLGEGLEKKSQDFAAEVAAQTAAKPTATAVVQEPVATETKEPVEKPPTVVVSASLVKQLRDETGAGMMDCKKALAETGGDLEKAQEYLRKKGLSTADKKSSRLAAEGRIGSYIHDSRIGVLIEVNCETDFVGRSENFKQLVDDLAMQVVACPQVQYMSIEDIPESIVNREKQLEMQREDLQSKPENIREKIVDGRIGKRLGELALLEQSFIKDDSLLVKDLVKQTVSGLGENVKVRRFVRFTLGESSDEETTEAQVE